MLTVLWPDLITWQVGGADCNCRAFLLVCWDVDVRDEGRYLPFFLVCIEILISDPWQSQANSNIRSPLFLITARATVILSACSKNEELQSTRVPGRGLLWGLSSFSDLLL
jgi:hypothetical protein